MIYSYHMKEKIIIALIIMSIALSGYALYRIQQLTTTVGEVFGKSGLLQKNDQGVYVNTVVTVDAFRKFIENANNPQ